MSAQEKELQWLGIARHWQASGLSQADFCRQERIEYKAFCRWRKILIKRQLLPGPLTSKKLTRRVTRPAVKFVPVEINHTPSELAAISRTSVLEISTPSGYVMRFS
jgi:hypothetical protein